MIFKIVSLLADINLRVLALVCNQEPSPSPIQAAWCFCDSILNNFEKRLAPKFMRCMMIVPHLMKYSRNDLFNYDIVAESAEIIISFGVNRQMYDLEKSSFCPKFT